MTISSLQDLNTYSLTPITYNDVRPARVTFDRGATVPQSLTISENNTYEFPYGINIEDITQFDVALVEYIIDLSNHPVPVNVTWNFLPAHVTVSRTNNIFTVSNIRSRQDWLFVRLARAQPPFGFSGLITHTGSLTFFADSAAQNRTVAAWLVTLTVIEIEYFSAAPDLTYVANEVKSDFATTSIIAQADEFDPVWTLRIAASDPVIDQITADAGTWNNLTKEFVVTGSTAVCNSALSSLSIEFLRSDKNFNLFFILANNFTASIETQFQAFDSRDFISDNNITSGFVATGKQIKGIVAQLNATSQLSGSLLDTATIVELDPTTISSQFALSGELIPAIALRIRSTMIVSTFEDLNYLSNTSNLIYQGVVPDFSNAIDASSSYVIELVATSGSFSYPNDVNNSTSYDFPTATIEFSGNFSELSNILELVKYYPDKDFVSNTNFRFKLYSNSVNSANLVFDSNVNLLFAGAATIPTNVYGMGGNAIGSTQLSDAFGDFPTVFQEFYPTFEEIKYSTMDVLILGTGGVQGSGDLGGGAGGGQAIELFDLPITEQTYTVRLPLQGASNCEFLGFVAQNGANGANGFTTPGNGGSTTGGGAGGSGVTAQVFGDPKQPSPQSKSAGGGGAGAGGPGGNAEIIPLSFAEGPGNQFVKAGVGGSGRSSSITGLSRFYGLGSPGKVRFEDTSDGAGAGQPFFALVSFNFPHPEETTAQEFFSTSPNIGLMIPNGVNFHGETVSGSVGGDGGVIIKTRA